MLTRAGKPVGVLLTHRRTCGSVFVPGDCVFAHERMASSLEVVEIGEPPCLVGSEAPKCDVGGEPLQMPARE